MKEPPATTELYARFAAREATPESPLYAHLAAGVAGDSEVVALLDQLPRPKRQPNLLFAAVRYVYGTPATYGQLRRWLLDGWPPVEAEMRARRTQTNEAARCAALLPLLAQLDEPLALIEVGASAGLCLYPDRYRYDYDGHLVGPAESPLTIGCAVSGAVPLPTDVPKVGWRGGVDLNPLDVTRPDDVRWLECLVWPGQDHRVARLHAAAEVAAADPPTILAGDLFDRLPEVVALLPVGVTPVVFHTAVAAYLDTDDRQRLRSLVGRLPGHWVCQEGIDVFPSIAARLPRRPPEGTPPFVLALDGEPVAFTAPHGGRLAWL